MKKFLKWLSLILGIFFVFILLSYFLISSIVDSEPFIYEHSYLYISLFGEIPEYVPFEGFEGLVESTNLDMHSIRNSIKMAANDDRIKAIIIKINPILTGFGKIEAIQQSIQSFRKSGKKVYAFFDFMTTKDYYLATSCDSIFCAPEGTLLLTGVRAELTFYKDLLKHIGIDADFEHVGKYKNAPDTYMRNTISREQKEVVNNIIAHRYEQILSQVSKQRNLSSDDIDSIVNNISGLTPDEAFELNLIDGLYYYNEIEDQISPNKKIHKISISDYSKISPSSLGLENGPKIAIIYGSGTITGGNDSDDPFLGQTMGSARLVRNILLAADSKRIKAIIIRINSPGGSGIAADEVLNAINYARSKKPVIASISDLGASGGYYIALGADTIMCQSSSLVGSIGVFAGKFSFEKLYKNWGINTKIIQKGKNASLFSLSRKFSKSERKVVRKIIQDFYSGFIQKVSEYRSMTLEQAHNLAQGRVWTGTDAYNLGLVDTLGSLNTAIEIVKNMIDIPANIDPEIVVYPRKKSVLSQLLKNLTLVNQSKDLYILNNVIKLMRNFELKPLALMPYSIKIE